ncbi:MAG TPA: UDP-N-acetylmuramate dehydrogenase [Methylomirabilota bacterium]|nr:UDP-N-acetylmuramate dehydrogenase [Methylomirabilota bacterium]
MVTPREHVALAPHCTMRIGGTARYLVEAADEAAVRAAVEWAQGRGLPVRVLGGGSNLVIADEGVDGLVLKIALRGITTRPRDGAIEVTAAAGEPWDAFVRHTVEQGWAGLECLSGIPGLVGATPIQNVGAYGQEVSGTVTAVRALDRESGQVLTLTPAECGFGYRDSVFKRRFPGRHVVLAVTYRLTPGGAPSLGYADLTRDLERRGIARPSLAQVRETVLSIRRSKSMVLDPDDENARSCGSFFLNPIVDPDAFAAIEARAAGLDMPRWPQPDGSVKLSAAWLIERAGFRRGQREGPVGLSTRHTLAIVCHDGARARDVVAFARTVRAGVERRFGVRLHPEPVFWGPLGVD